MEEIRVGSWVVDLDSGTVAEGAIVISVIFDGAGNFTVRHSGDIPEARRDEIASEAISVFKRAKAVSIWLSKKKNT